MTVRSHSPGPPISRLVPLLGVLCLAILDPVASHAQSPRFKFTKIADRNTPIPGATVNFNSFSSAALDSDRVAFAGWGPGGVKGVYTAVIGGPVTLVANDATGVPGPIQLLTTVQWVSIDGTRMALGGLNTLTRGVYLVANGTVSTIADSNTPIPSGSGNFLYQIGGLPSADDGQVAFVGSGENMQRGVYLASPAGLTRVADTTTPVPGDMRNFETFSSVVLDGESLAFVGNPSNRPGIYQHDLATGGLTRVADTTTPIPGRAETFRLFDHYGRGIDIDGTQLAFIGGLSNNNAVYLFDSATGMLSTVADPGMPIPDGDGRLFTYYFGAVSVHNGRIVFQHGGELLQTQSPTDGPTLPPFGVYANFNGSLEKVLDSGDLLDGQLVYSVSIGQEALDGDQIAMTVGFIGGTQGVYIATLIPEPGTLALVITAFGFVALIAYRRSRSALPRRT